MIQLQEFLLTSGALAQQCPDPMAREIAFVDTRIREQVEVDKPLPVRQPTCKCVT